jgi:uncharacterized protein (TIGR02646 family)
MPDIAVAYTYTPEEQQTIEQRKQVTGFSHQNWSDVELMGVRSSLREHYRIQQTGVCCYCRNMVSLQSALNSHVEHIAPKSLYPDFMFNTKNMCVICSDCNEIKRQQEVLSEVPDTINDGSGRRRYPWASNSFKIIHPHIDEYDDHIIQVGKLYVDRTPKGHFTIGACKLNRYVQKFGWETELVNEAEVSTMMNEFLNSPNAVDRRKKLLLLQDKLMKVNL